MEVGTNELGQELRHLTAEIVAAYVGNNSVALSDISGVIASVHTALRTLGEPKSDPAPEKPVPPVPIKRSITQDYLISLEDGRQYKSLRRHLGGRGLTPEQYREKWGLPRDYPMVAPSYAKQRSELAKAAGLGQSRRRTDVEAPKRPRRKQP